MLLSGSPELGLVQSFQFAPTQGGSNLYRVYVKRTHSSPEVLLTDIPVSVFPRCCRSWSFSPPVPPGSTVILEQPEIHLHPAVQSALADVILESALVRDVQVIVESHSEHLLKRIQLRVAEQELANGTALSGHDDVKLWFVDQPGAVSQTHDLKINDYGEITNWPERTSSAIRLRRPLGSLKAGLRRRRSAAQS